MLNSEYTQDDQRGGAPSAESGPPAERRRAPLAAPDLPPPKRAQLRTKYRNLLHESHLLRDLAPELCESLISIGALQTWKRGSYLFEAGKPVSRFFLLLSGKSREYYSGANGEEYLRRLVLPGAFIGLHSLFSWTRQHSHACQALTSATTFTWEIDPFMAHMNRHPDLGRAVATILADHFEQSCRRACLCGKPAARNRVAGYLLSRMHAESRFQNQPGNSGPDQTLDLWPLTHAAADINLTREAFSRALLTLQKQSVVHWSKGKVTIIDLAALKAISGVE